MTVHSKALIRFISHEIPSGDINNINTVFQLANIPIENSLVLTLNGMVQSEGITKDYTISGMTITFNKPPIFNSELLAFYSI
jgi:hypothetical protein